MPTTQHDATESVQATESVAKKKARLLYKLRIGEVSLVPEGEGIAPRVAFWKMRPTEGQGVVKMEEKLNALPPKLRDMLMAMPEAVRPAVLDAIMVAMESVAPSEPAAKMDEPNEEQVAKMRDLETTVAKMRADAKAQEAVVAKMREELATTQRQARVAKARVANADWIEFVPGQSPDDIASDIVAADEGDARAKRLVDVAKAAAKHTADVTTPRGTSHTEPESDTLFDEVKKLRAQDPKLTPEAARLQAMRDPRFARLV